MLLKSTSAIAIELENEPTIAAISVGYIDSKKVPKINVSTPIILHWVKGLINDATAAKPKLSVK